MYVFAIHTVKNEKFTATQFFSSNQFRVKFFIQRWFDGKFAKKLWQLNSFSGTYFWQKFRQNNSFTKEITKYLSAVIWRNNFSVRHSVEKQNNSCHATQFFSRQSNLEETSLVKSWFDGIFAKKSWSKIP